MKYYTAIKKNGADCFVMTQKGAYKILLRKKAKYRFICKQDFKKIKYITMCVCV